MFQIITKFKNPYFSGHPKNIFLMDKPLYSEFSEEGIIKEKPVLI